MMMYVTLWKLGMILMYRQNIHTLKIKIKEINKRKYPLKGTRFFKERKKIICWTNRRQEQYWMRDWLSRKEGQAGKGMGQMSWRTSEFLSAAHAPTYPCFWSRYHGSPNLFWGGRGHWDTSWSGESSTISFMKCLSLTFDIWPVVT